MEEVAAATTRLVVAGLATFGENDTSLVKADTGQMGGGAALDGAAS